jgi:hypothetical protein
MKKLVSIFGMLLVLLLMIPIGTPLPTEASPMQAANIPATGAVVQGQTSVGSTNWSGYAVTGSNATSVSGSWVVPPVVASGTTTSYSAAWVGIDGYSSSTVEQIGTMQEYSVTRSASGPIYYAWYEMYPSGMFELSPTAYPVKPGDTMNATVVYDSGNEFSLTLSDSNSYSKGWKFSSDEIAGSVKQEAGTFQNSPNPVENYDSQLFDRSSSRTQGPARSSVEWIMEAPSSGMGILPLADFGNINFSNATASINDKSGAINALGTDYAITMVTNSGVTKAQPSGLTNNGSSFSVAWEHN